MMEGLKAALEHVEELARENEKLRSLRYVARLMPTRA